MPNARNTRKAPGPSSQKAWSSHVERATIVMPDPELADAIERFEALGDLAEQMTLAQEIARTRQSELTLAFDNVVTVASGFKTRCIEGSETLTRIASVVFIVRRKWNAKGPSLQRIPSHLLTYRKGRGRVDRELVAVPTDVQLAKRYSGARPHGPSSVFVDDGTHSDSGALACLVELRSGSRRRRLAMSALHVLTVSVDADANTLADGAEVIRRNSVKMPDGTPGMALSSPIGGRYVVGAGMSFDVQLAELSDPQAAQGMLDDLPLAANEPFIASPARFHQLVAANAPIEIMVPANHPAFIDQVRPRMSATFTGLMESGFAIPYDLKTGGQLVNTHLHHTELIRLQPLGGQMTLEGDSGCAVVCWLDDNNCTLLGMFIAGDEEFSYAIPAWQLFNKKNYFGSLDGVTSIRPVRA